TGGPLFLLMRYGSTSGKLLALAPEPVGGGPPPRRFVELPGGADRTNVFALDANEMRRVYLVLAPEAEVCLQRLAVGRLMPR
ncbi:MAG: hypothetical protein LC799_31285, partial [Actinobacteria bacterium]|nr:hypothetical protein [Actinomycetota bacterium]